MPLIEAPGTAAVIRSRDATEIAEHVGGIHYKYTLYNNNTASQVVLRDHLRGEPVLEVAVLDHRIQSAHRRRLLLALQLDLKRRLAPGRAVATEHRLLLGLPPTPARRLAEDTGPAEGIRIELAVRLFNQRKPRSDDRRRDRRRRRGAGLARESRGRGRGRGGDGAAVVAGGGNVGAMARGRRQPLDLVVAVVADTLLQDTRLGRVVGGDGDIAGGKEKVEAGGVEEGGGAGCADAAEDAAALAAVVAALEQRKGDSAVKVVAVGGGGVGLGT